MHYITSFSFNNSTRYRTRTIITRSWFETALKYKQQILGSKIESIYLFST